MLQSADHPLAFLPTYFSPNMQSLANSPAVNVPIDAIMLLVPLNPVAADHTVTKTTAPKDITVNKKLDTQSGNENHMILPPEKVSICAPRYLGPYRSDPNFTRGKKLSTVTAKSSTYVDWIQYSIPNDQFVVVKRKVTKHVDRSLPWPKIGKKEKTPTPRTVGGIQEKKMKEKLKRRY